MAQIFQLTGVFSPLFLQVFTSMPTLHRRDSGALLALKRAWVRGYSHLSFWMPRSID